MFRVRRTSDGSTPVVLHVIRFDELAGTEIQTARQVLGGDPAVVRELLATVAPPGPIRELLGAAGRPSYSLHGPLGVLGATLRLIRLMRRERVHLVIAYGFRVGLIARAGALLGGRPAVVIGVHGMHFAGSEDLDGWRTRLVIAVERALSWSVAAYDANSAGAAAFLAARGIPRAKLRVIPNAIEVADAPQAVHGVRDPPTVVVVARFISHKRHHLLIRALGRLAQEGCEFRCELIGRGPWLESSKALAEAVGIADRVSFRGQLPVVDVRQELARSDV